MLTALIITVYLALGVCAVYAMGFLGMLGENRYHEPPDARLVATLAMAAWPVVLVVVVLVSAAWCVGKAVDYIGNLGREKRKEVEDNRERIRQERRLAAGELKAAEKKVDEILTGPVRW